MRLFDPRQPGAFRLWLALLVVVDHLFGVHLGLVAVYLFFILSGFWIHRIWNVRYHSAPHAYLVFVFSRLARLAPAMACAMALALIMQWLAFGVTPTEALGRFGAMELLSHVLILGYGQTSGPMVLPPAWTLDLEIQFYLLAPALCAILKRIGITPFLALGIGTALVSPGLEWGIPVLPYLVLFMAGMAAAATDWRPSESIQKLSTILALTIIGAMAFGGYAQVFFDAGSAPATSRLNWILAIVLAPAALATVRRRDGDARDGMLGDLSYIVYLVHWPLLMGTGALAASIGSGAGMVLFLTTLAAMSLAVWRYADRPLNDWRTDIVARWWRRNAGLQDTPAAAVRSA